MEQSELIARAQNGDAAAMEALLEMHRPLLFSLAARLRCIRMGCEELVQAGYIGLIQALRHYDALQKAKLSTYAVPWILGEMRRALKWAESTQASLDEPVNGEGAQTLCDMLASSSGIDLGQIDLHLALERLSYDEQLLICLRYFRDKTQKETAILLGKSQAQISRMEQRALDTLRAVLE